MASRRSVRRRSAFAALAAASVLLLLEGLCRAVGLGSSGGASGSEESASVVGWDIGDGPGFKTEPGEVDHFRMRSPGYPEPKGDATRIVLAGDSTSFGFGLKLEDTIASRLGGLRGRRFPGTTYQAAACAVPGHSSIQTLAKLRASCMAFLPDLVVISSLFNDASLSDLSDKVRFSDHVPGLFPAPRSSALLMTVEQLLHPRTTPGEGTCTTASAWLPPGQDLCPGRDKPYVRVPLDDYGDNLLAMIRLVRDAGARPALLLMPHRNDGDGQRHGFEDYRDRMREVADAEHVALVDGARAFAESGEPGDALFTDRLHHLPGGAACLAAAIDATLGSSPP